MNLEQKETIMTAEDQPFLDDLFAEFDADETESNFEESVNPVFGRIDSRPSLQNLNDESDRDRGFLTSSDRQYLIHEHLSGQSERNTRNRIRDRILLAYYDARYLRYISDTDRRTLLDNAKDDRTLHFLEGFHEFVRFTWRGLSDYDIGTGKVIESAISQAVKQEQVLSGANKTVSVSLDIDIEDANSVSSLKEKYDRGEKLSENELATLVHSDSIEIDLADALYYQARQITSSPVPSKFDSIDLASSGPPSRIRRSDAKGAKERQETLRSIFLENGITSFEQYYASFERSLITDDEKSERLREAVRYMQNHAPPLEQQLAAESGLSLDDMELLKDLLWNLDGISVRKALYREAKPRTAESPWDPNEDASLQKFITRVELAREEDRLFISDGQKKAERWSELLQIAGYDPEEWGDYMHKLKVENVIAELNHEAEEGNIALDALDEMDNWETQYKYLYDNVGSADAYHIPFEHGEEVFMEALEAMSDG